MSIDDALDALVSLEVTLPKVPILRPRKTWPVRLSLEGQPLQQVDQSSRCVFRMGDYAVKAMRAYSRVPETGVNYIGQQSWHEYAVWHSCVSVSDVAHLFAPTHAYMALSVMDDDGKQAWVELSLQSFVDQGCDLAERRLHNPYHECVYHVEDGYPDITDIGGDQCVFDAQRGHYVLVDYGLWDDWPCKHAHERADNAISHVRQKVRIGEKVLVRGGLDSIPIV